MIVLLLTKTMFWQQLKIFMNLSRNFGYFKNIGDVLQVSQYYVTWALSHCFLELLNPQHTQINKKYKKGWLLQICVFCFTRDRVLGYGLVCHHLTFFFYKFNRIQIFTFLLCILIYNLVTCTPSLHKPVHIVRSNKFLDELRSVY